MTESQSMNAKTVGHYAVVQISVRKWIVVQQTNTWGRNADIPAYRPIATFPNEFKAIEHIAQLRRN